MVNVGTLREVYGTIRRMKNRKNVNNNNVVSYMVHHKINPLAY